jgi:peroxiredoxin
MNRATRGLLAFGSLGLFLVVVACEKPQPAPSKPADPFGGYPPIPFKDAPESNREANADDLDLTFVGATGKPLALRDYRGKRHLVLVFTRGFSGRLCPYCMTQTSRLISNYEEFQARDAEVVVVYPGPKEKVEEFIAASKALSETPDRDAPFPVVLDEDFKAVEKLGIRGNLASPSTYILDKEGQVRFAYVGAADADRPSIKAMLDQLDALNPEKKNDGKPGHASEQKTADVPG